MKKRIIETEKLDRTDWEKVRNMTEEEIEAGANSDPDAPLLTDEQLKRFKRVHPPEVIDVKQVRLKLGLSQEKFAHYFGVSIRTIQEWEQERRVPNATARNFLKVVEMEPEAVQRALAEKDDTKHK